MATEKRKSDKANDVHKSKNHTYKTTLRVIRILVERFEVTLFQKDIKVNGFRQ
jgi:hypothetical protein